MVALLRRIDLHLDPDRPGLNHTSTHLNLHVDYANRGASCTWICTIPSANVTCHVHLLKCKLHLPFALQNLTCTQKPVKLQRWQDSGANQGFKVLMASAIYTWNGQVQFALDMMRIQVQCVP